VYSDCGNRVQTGTFIAIDQPLSVGSVLPIASGIEVIHVPAHGAGQVALLWHRRRMRAMRARTLWALVTPSDSRIWGKVVRASANLPVFHSTPLGSAIVGLSPTMRRRVFEISGATNRLPDMTDPGIVVPRWRRRCQEVNSDRLLG
jgi:hypothetical protein